MGGGGLGLSHAEALRLTIPQICNLLRSESPEGGPVKSVAMQRRELEQRQKESEITKLAVEQIRRGRRRK